MSPRPVPQHESPEQPGEVNSRAPKKKQALRVLFIDHTAKLGGGEIALFSMVQALDRDLVTPILMTFEEGPLVERLRESIEVHVLPLRADVSKASKDALGWRSLMRLGSVLAVFEHIWKIRRIIRRLQVDLVHTNSLKSDIVGGLGGRLAGVPVIWHVRDRIAPDYLPAKVVRVFRGLSRLIPTSLIAVSEATLRTLQTGGRPEGEQSRLTVVYDGIQLPELIPPASSETDHGDVPRERQIGLIGRICPWKGQHIFLQSAASLHKRFPDVRFQIIGSPLFDEQQYDADLRQLCRTLGIEDVVTFTGFVQDVPRRIAELEIVVHASVIGEPFGLVIIEGMAQGKPVVATNGGGVPEIVVDGVTGILIPLADSPAMTEAIASLLERPEVGRQMGISGRQRVAEHFTLEQTARKVEALYQRLSSSMVG